MDPLHILLVLTSLVLVVVVADLVVDLRQGIPRRRRAEQREDALRAVRAAEAHHGPGKGEVKARHATEMLLDLHPTMKPATARLLVQGAVSEVRKP